MIFVLDYYDNYHDKWNQRYQVSLPRAFSKKNLCLRSFTILIWGNIEFNSVKKFIFQWHKVHSRAIGLWNRNIKSLNDEDFYRPPSYVFDWSYRIINNTVFPILSVASCLFFLVPDQCCGRLLLNIDICIIRNNQKTTLIISSRANSKSEFY